MQLYTTSAWEFQSTHCNYKQRSYDFFLFLEQFKKKKPQPSKFHWFPENVVGGVLVLVVFFFFSCWQLGDQ